MVELVVTSFAEIDLEAYDPTEWVRCIDPHRPVPPKLLWAELVAREPLLAPLLGLVNQVRPRKDFCANSVWYGYANWDGGIRELLQHFVGWEAVRDDPVLRTPEAYDLAYGTLYAALPDCQHHGPCG